MVGSQARSGGLEGAPQTEGARMSSFLLRFGRTPGLSRPPHPRETQHALGVRSCTAATAFSGSGGWGEGSTPGSSAPGPQGPRGVPATLRPSVGQSLSPPTRMPLQGLAAQGLAQLGVLPRALELARGDPSGPSPGRSWAAPSPAGQAPRSHPPRLPPDGTRNRGLLALKVVYCAQRQCSLGSSVRGGGAGACCREPLAPGTPAACLAAGRVAGAQDGRRPRCSPGSRSVLPHSCLLPHLASMVSAPSPPRWKTLSPRGATLGQQGPGHCTIWGLGGASGSPPPPVDSPGRVRQHTGLWGRGGPEKPPGSPPLGWGPPPSTSQPGLPACDLTPGPDSPEWGWSTAQLPWAAGRPGRGSGPLGVPAAAPSGGAGNSCGEQAGAGRWGKVEEGWG